MSLLSSNFLNCVLALGRKPAGEWSATGFLCSKNMGNDRYHFIVTNKHVFTGELKLYIRLFNVITSKYESVELRLVNEQSETQNYSTHETEDIAVALLVGGYLEKKGFKWSGFDVDNGMMSSGEYFEAGGSVGSRVFMLGYPMGLADIEKNNPICRGGYIARKEENGFLLDIQNFPGNSGSPIICCPEPIALSGTTPLNESAVIGIVNSYIPYQRPLIDQQTGSVVEIQYENSGLANACFVESIREVIDAELKRIHVL